jgi:hypothetical protein
LKHSPPIISTDTEAEDLEDATDAGVEAEWREWVVGKRSMDHAWTVRWPR